jgi:hypothetical protein
MRNLGMSELRIIVYVRGYVTGEMMPDEASQEENLTLRPHFRKRLG